MSGVSDDDCEDEWNEIINKRDEGGDAKGICCTYQSGLRKH
jgi:hypothetical protein